MAEYRTARVKIGVNDDGVDCYGPAEPINAPIVEITDTEYVYLVPDAPQAEPGD